MDCGRAGGWRLSPSASLLRAPYGANKVCRQNKTKLSAESDKCLETGENNKFLETGENEKCL